MLGRIAILFAGIVVAAVLFNLYIIIIGFFTIFIFGLNDPTALEIQYWFCLAAGVATAFILMRPAWGRSGDSTGKQSSVVKTTDRSTPQDQVESKPS